MKKYQSALLRTVHEDAEGYYKVGIIDAAQMHQFDVACLVPSAVPIREAGLGSTERRSSAPISTAVAARD
ncbi:hypothetical protein ACYULU_01370 [Breznakiellaceae bacterium SP9]